MKLNYKQSGEGKTLIILHGLFGMSDNWASLGKTLSENFCVYLIDQRNHGLSPHNKAFNYEAMSNDLLEFYKDHQIQKAIIIGHSMGGKTAMEFTIRHPDKVEKLIVVDIAPKEYPVTQTEIIEALLTVDFTKITTRKETEEILSVNIHEQSIRQFLLKNLFWKEPKQLNWRFNLEAISKNISKVGKPQTGNCLTPTLFMRGALSDYISDTDIPEIKKQFPNSTTVTISNARHWVHTENPQDFMEAVNKFCV